MHKKALKKQTSPHSERKRNKGTGVRVCARTHTYMCRVCMCSVCTESVYGWLWVGVYVCVCILVCVCICMWGCACMCRMCVVWCLCRMYVVWYMCGVCVGCVYLYVHLYVCMGCVCRMCVVWCMCSVCIGCMYGWVCMCVWRCACMCSVYVMWCMCSVCVHVCMCVCVVWVGKVGVMHLHACMGEVIYTWAGPASATAKSRKVLAAHLLPHQPHITQASQATTVSRQH